MNYDFTADGKHLAVTDQGKNVTIWNVSTSKVVLAFKHDGPEGLLATALSLDGKWFACEGPGGGLKVWDVDKGAELRTFPVLHGLSSFLFSPDNALLAAGENSGVVKIWDLASRPELCKAEVPRAAFGMTTLQPRWKAAGRTTRPWPGAYTRCGKRPRGLAASQLFMPGGPFEFSRDGNRLAMGTSSGTVIVWDLSTGQETLTLTGHTTAIAPVSRSAPTGTA